MVGWGGIHEPHGRTTERRSGFGIFQTLLGFYFPMCNAYPQLRKSNTLLCTHPPKKNPTSLLPALASPTVPSPNHSGYLPACWFQEFSSLGRSSMNTLPSPLYPENSRLETQHQWSIQQQPDKGACWIGHLLYTYECHFPRRPVRKVIATWDSVPAAMLGQVKQLRTYA